MKNREDNGLEKFIRNNRGDFDQYDPPAGLWDKIMQEMEEGEAPAAKKKEAKVIKIPVRSLYRVAAAMLILGGSYIAYKFIPQQAAQNAAGEAVALSYSLNDIDPDLAEAEAYYTQLIAEKKNEIEQYRSKRINIDDSFYKDLDELDSLYDDLKTELYEIPSKERVVNAMIQNLRIRIEILNKQLEVLERIQQIQNGEGNNEHKIST